MRVTQTTGLMIATALGPLAAALGALALFHPVRPRQGAEPIVACREVRELGALIARPIDPPLGCRAVPAEEVCRRLPARDQVAGVVTCDGELLWTSAP